MVPRFVARVFTQHVHTNSPTGKTTVNGEQLVYLSSAQDRGEAWRAVVAQKLWGQEPFSDSKVVGIQVHDVLGIE